jgi:hypothetical protein
MLSVWTIIKKSYYYYIILIYENLVQYLPLHRVIGFLEVYEQLMYCHCTPIVSPVSDVCKNVIMK